MSDLETLGAAELKTRLASLKEKFDAFKHQNLSLNMARGKPCPEQLDLSMDMLGLLKTKDDLKDSNGNDIRNYGGLDGIPDAKTFFAEMLEVSPKEILIGGNSSLNIMHDTLSMAMFHGVYGSPAPWSKLPSVKFICPSPGYDRHFAICEQLNIGMVVVDMLDDGPDMDQVEKLAGSDPSIKGIWCVPKYSNPDGITYSDEVVDRLAGMETAAADFRIFWDNAYIVHHLTDRPDLLKNIMKACSAAGHPDRVFMYSSTSKVTFPGAGVAMMASSENNLNFFKKQLSVQTIGPDKFNQLRHVRFLKDRDTLKAHMRKHAAILKPKFDTVLKILESELGDKKEVSWHKPNGGYFISLNTPDGCAKEVVAMAAEAGVTLTPAGATFPYGNDPRDRNIRIAPSFPSLSELTTAIKILCLCIEIVIMKKSLSREL
ncbi:aminotransferase [Sporolactobacillus putidus]|uniref:Aminotransferase n=1 Tax=Sporolactobacillus putidus TaxID=492735 RepID=A0A917S1X1_9BACL|nr:aminotransferase [Sporolactobacillus putidus]GGL51566.1 aminotransferase [Sporolactobacillus putidus]